MHSLSYELALFAGSLVLVILSSVVLTASVEKTGARLGFSEALLGIVTALGADAPEISSAISALAAGHHDLGIGVVLGSNVFNLAALLGVSALVAGAVRPGRDGLLLDGGMALLVTLIGAGLIGGILPPWLSAVLLGALLVPYIWISSLYPTHVQKMNIAASVRNFLASALADVRDDSKKNTRLPKATLIDILALVPALFAIIAASRGLVSASVSLSERFHIPHATVGLLIIAGLTGIPNMIAAVRLAVRSRGAAVVTETFNSNTLNIVAGICLPALIMGSLHASSRTIFVLWWLIGMTIATVAFAYWRNGIRRLGGVILLALYAAFAVTIIFWR